MKALESIEEIKKSFEDAKKEGWGGDCLSETDVDFLLRAFEVMQEIAEKAYARGYGDGNSSMRNGHVEFNMEPFKREIEEKFESRMSPSEKTPG